MARENALGSSISCPSRTHLCASIESATMSILEHNTDSQKGLPLIHTGQRAESAIGHVIFLRNNEAECGG
jgi:hypothetical protein